VIRAAAGLLLVGHGSQKLFGWFGGHGPEGTGAAFESLALRPGRRLAAFAGVAEIAGGGLLAAGLVTPLGEAPLSAVMLAAIWTVHRANGLGITEGGFEYNLVLMAAAFGVTATGPGEWSLDHVLGLDVTGVGWALAALAVGALGAIATIAPAQSSTRRSVRRPAGGRIARARRGAA
jgi:putative oxidoreductase